MDGLAQDAGMARPPLAVDGRVTLDGGALKRLRLQAGLSQEALAERCLRQRLCVSIASIKRAEAGRAVLYRTARHLATVYEVPLESLWQQGEAPGDNASSVQAVAQPALGHDRGPDIDADLRSVIALQLTLVANASPGAAATVARLVQQFGGVLQPDPASGLLGVFGVPRAYLSDASRCLQCAISWPGLEGECSLRVDTRLGRRALPARGHEARLRILAAAGTRDHRHVGIGPAPSVSRSRLCRAPPRWRRLLHAEPPRRGAPSNLIGRYAEVRQFKAIMEITEACQSGHVVGVRGIAGIGKSRLVSELADMARQGGFGVHRATVLDFGVESDGTALGQLARSLIGLPPYAAGEAAEMLEDRLTRHGLPPEHAMSFRAMTGRPQAEAQALSYAAMAHATQQRAEALAALMLGGPSHIRC
jgi:transcriptional regulator with XRE-family HTH domain